MDRDLQKAGEKVRRRALGDDYVHQTVNNAEVFGAPFQSMLSEYCWGACWSDGPLGPKQRSLLNLGTLSALDRMHEFAIRFRGAIRNALSAAELQAAPVQVSFCCGVPAGDEARRVARQVRQEMAQGA